MAWDDAPQSARGWLYLLKPSIVMQAQVNMAAATYPAHEITFDNVDGAYGTYTDIKVGQTVMIGSSPGEYDLGRTYVRATPTSTTLPIGWASRGKNPGEVVLSDDAYVTVLDMYEVWYKPGRLDLATGAMYKDYDLDGTTPPSPILCVGDVGGLGRIGFADAGVLVVDLFDWSGSALVNDGETWVSREWDFGDGTILTGSTTSADPVVEFPVGYRWITLTGEGSDGGITTRRYLVVVLDPDAPDVILFDKKDLRRTADGQTLTVSLREYLIPEEYPPGTVCMYLAREKRGSTVTITQRFAGWLDVENSSAVANRTGTQRTTTLTAVDVAGKLAQLRSMPTTVANEATQATWLEMVDANPERYIHRLLAFETTALTLADWTLTGLTGSAAYPFMDFWTSGGTMWSVCVGLAIAMAHELTCDSQGRLWILPNPMRQNAIDRTTDVQRHITEADWRQLGWAARSRPTVGALTSQMVVISSGYASTLPTPFPDEFSVSPGLVPGQGSSEQGMNVGIVASETEAHERIGHDYARLTANMQPYQITLAHGVDADIEPAHMTWVQLTALYGRAGYRGPSLLSVRGLPLEVVLSVDTRTGVGTQSLTWEKETVGEIGDERNE